MFYKVVIETGHRRGEKNFQIIRYLKAHNSVHLFDMLEGEPGITGGNSGYAITMVKTIGSSEYEEGLAEEKKNPVNLRANVRFRIRKKCTLSFGNGLHVRGETANISSGGIGVNFGGALLEKGKIVQVTIKDLQILEKEAEIVWCLSKNQRSYAGLRWL